MTQTTTTQTTVAFTNVPFAQASKEEQQARIAAAQQNVVKRASEAGLANGRRVFGFLAVAKVQEDNIVSESGKAGKHFLFIVVENKVRHFFNMYEYTEKKIAQYERLIDYKKQNGKHALVSGIVGDKVVNGKTYVNAVDLFPVNRKN